MNTHDIHVSSKKGRRDTYEDTHKIIRNDKIKFIMINDGHGGNIISNFLKQKLPKFFIDNRLTYPLNPNYIIDVFKHIQEVIKTKFRKIANESGSTCLIIICYKDNNDKYLLTINLGDSRAIISKNNKAYPLTIDHKPNNDIEKKRIEDLGGVLDFDGSDWRISNLAVSRSFGDIDVEPYISCVPDIFRYKIEKDDKFVVVACDGLWDVMTNQEVSNFVLKQNKTENIAEKLAIYAIKKGSTDNLTIIIMFIN